MNSYQNCLKYLGIELRKYNKKVNTRIAYSETCFLFTSIKFYKIKCSYSYFNSYIEKDLHLQVSRRILIFSNILTGLKE